MMKRPLCLLCLIFMAGICAVYFSGAFGFRSPPENPEIAAYLRDHPQVARIYGQIYRRTPLGDSVCLRNSYLQTQTEVIPLENVKVYMEKETDMPVGAGVLMTGKLQKIPEAGNPGQFDSVLYYRTQHIVYRMVGAEGKIRRLPRFSWGETLAVFRDRISESLARAAGEYAPLYQAMLLGDKSGLEDETKDRYQMAGMLHVLAISGLHLSLIGMCCFRLLQRVGASIPLAGSLSLFVMFSYGILTGEGVATMRALCMFALVMGAKMLGRTYDLLSALALSAILLLLDSPYYLFYSGFLLSYGSICGIALVLPSLERLFAVPRQNPRKRRLLHTVCGALTVSASVQIMTLPITLFFFYEFPLYGIFLNLAVIPALSGVLIAGIAAGFAGLIAPAAAGALAAPGNLLLRGYDCLGILVSHLPAGTWVTGQPKLWQAAVYYALLFLALRLGVNRRRRDSEYVYSPLRRLGVLAVIALSAALLTLREAPGFRIACLDVGQGDGIAVETPSGRHYLVDGGSSNVQEVGRYRLLPYLKSQGISRLDYVWVSHTDNDHISGILEILRLQAERRTSVRIANLLLPDWEVRPKEYRELEQAAREAGVRTQFLRAGDRLMDGEVTWRVLSPSGGGEDVNESALVMELEYGTFQGLFTGDIGMETEEQLGALLEDIDFLKVAHHGSRYSTGEPFLQKTRPELAVISVSSTNTYGHPHPDTLKRLAESGSRVWCTKDSGAVTVTVKAGKMEAETFLGR